MSSLVAQSFPELAFLVMRENPNITSFNLRMIVELAINMQIVNKIESQYEEYSDDWIEVLNGAMKRESGEEHANNEGKFCVFRSIGTVCTGPWNLRETPLVGESYASYRYRHRKSNTVKMGARGIQSRLSEQARKFAEKPALKVFMTLDPIHIIGPNDQDGDGESYIYIFENAVEFRNEYNETHREGNLPAYFWFGKSKQIKFATNGNEHRIDGPAVLYEDMENDEYFICGSECGVVSEERAVYNFEKKYLSVYGAKLDDETRNILNEKRYKNIHFYEDEIERYFKLVIKYFALCEDDYAASIG